MIWLTFVTPLVCSQEVSGSLMDYLVTVERIRKSNPDQFDKMLDKVSDLEKSRSTEERCFYKFLRYYQEGHLGDYNNTIEKLDLLAAQCKGVDNQLRIKKFLANMQMIKGDFKQAISNLNTAIELTNSTNDNYLKSQVFNVAAISYRLMHQDSLSIKYADILINSNLNPEDLCLGQFNKYRVLMRQGKALKFEENIKEAIDNCYLSKNTIASLFLQFDWYRYTIRNQSEANNAAVNLKLLNDEVSETGFKNIQVYYQALLSRILLQAGDNEAANVFAIKAIQNNLSIGESEQLLMALEVLIDISIQQGNFKQAYEYTQQKSRTENKTYERKLATQVAYYRVLHENLAQELEIEQLNRNNQLLSLENLLANETSKKQKLMMLLVLSLLILLGLWTYKIKRKHDYFKEVAEIDHLTQVFTRKAFEEHMKAMLAASKIKQEPVNLAIMDLDHFKNVNDQHGHLVGDWVLKAVIKTCEQVADQDIMIARLGGEEFALVCPGISLLHMMDLIDKLRIAIEQMDCTESGSSINITASFGVTNTELSGARTSMLLTHADLALFEAKNNGRNQVVSYDSKVMKSPVVSTS